MVYILVMIRSKKISKSRTKDMDQYLRYCYKRDSFVYPGINRKESTRGYLMLFGINTFSIAHDVSCWMYYCQMYMYLWDFCGWHHLCIVETLTILWVAPRHQMRLLLELLESSRLWDVRTSRLDILINKSSTFGNLKVSMVVMDYFKGKLMHLAKKEKEKFTSTTHLRSFPWVCPWRYPSSKFSNLVKETITKNKNSLQMSPNVKRFFHI
jgi:hypothetical protein